MSLVTTTSTVMNTQTDTQSTDGATNNQIGDTHSTINLVDNDDGSIPNTEPRRLRRGTHNTNSTVSSDNTIGPTKLLQNIITPAKHGNIRDDVCVAYNDTTLQTSTSTLEFSIREISQRMV